eukprot:CAMPEP_0118975188 /NCGR_PEP_ID=MMETSP1173-20130426/14801_1 /TAXON_ID=1034831 /ORGANISM="Rhizochromulina marina cf, Strain CCMP1243" /LENGTH=109 /DNA_ID=CAMNT_0006925029 /DNA_START=84 /DNA_END=410 /DNA_ORIENTATION=+
MAAFGDGVYEDATQYMSKQKRLSNEVRLDAYGLFKQAGVGDNGSVRPGLLDMVGRAKWDAWHKLRGMSATVAKQKYIALAQTIGFNPGASGTAELVRGGETFVQKGGSA